MRAWRNWSGEQMCTPVRWLRPATTEQVADAVRQAAAEGLVVRAVGSGHSFSPIALTDGVLLDLSACDRLLEVDHGANEVRVQAGITLAALGEQLARRGLAFENLGDIDRQTVTGATATGTHGTGGSLGNLSTQIEALRLVDGNGEIHDIPAGDPRLPGARVGLGALGVVTEITLRVLPAYTLRGRDRTEPLDEVLDTFHDRVAAHRHFEFFVFPYSDRALTRTNDPVDAPADPPGAVRSWIDERLLTTHALGAISRLGRRAHRAIPTLNRTVTRLAGSRERIDAAHRVFASARDVRFTEMELAVPRQAGIPLVTAILELVERERFPVNFPLEVRTTAADDSWLSPAYGRDTTYVAVHNFVGMPFEEYFAAVWELACRHIARPHWGKRHPARADDLARRYPRWDEFATLRAQLDPDERFANAHLADVLGPVRNDRGTNDPGRHDRGQAGHRKQRPSPR